MANNKIGEIYGQGVPNQTIKGHPLVVGTHFVGVEIELEGIRDQNFQSEYWHMKGDGSLRNNGQEFVCKGPTGGVDLFNAVVEIDRFLFDKNPDGNWRCSTHVHLDVRDMTGSEIKNLIIIYLTLEKLIFRLSGFHRYKNNFCCSIGFAQNQLRTLIDNWSIDDTYAFTNRLIGRWDKYSALNLVPISSFGTVEFRMSEPKWRKGKLLLLCNRFLAMKELAKSWTGSHEELVNYLMTTDLYLIFKKGLPKEIPVNFEEDLEVGFKLVNDLLVLSQEQPFLGEKGPRNDIGNAQQLWDMFKTRGKKQVPFELYLDDSPKATIQHCWPQVKVLANRAGLVNSDLVMGEMNYSTIRWYEFQLGLGRGVLVTGEEREVYSEYFNANDRQKEHLVRDAFENCGMNGFRNEDPEPAAPPAPPQHQVRGHLDQMLRAAQAVGARPVPGFQMDWAGVAAQHANWVRDDQGGGRVGVVEPVWVDEMVGEEHPLDVDEGVEEEDEDWEDDNIFNP